MFLNVLVKSFFAKIGMRKFYRLPVKAVEVISLNHLPIHLLQLLEE